MKKLFYMAVAAVAALSSCTGEGDAILENENTTNGVTAFVASIENGATTRVTLETATPTWEAGDAISIDGHEYIAAAGGATDVRFTGTGATEATHHAYFPTDLYKEGTIKLPVAYKVEAKFNMPMYAESTTENLAFKNLCGVLAITVLPDQMSSVDGIEVSSDKRMNGAFTVTSDGVLTFTSEASDDADKKVTITASAAVEIPAVGKTFYVPVPAGTHNPLKITVIDGTNKKVMTTTKSDGVVVERNYLYSIVFADNSLAPWETPLTLGKTTVTSITFETGKDVSSYNDDATHKPLNSAGTLWEVLDGSTLRIQTSASKILGHDTFVSGSKKVGLFEGYRMVTDINGSDNIDMSQVTDMSQMFKSCNKLNSLTFLANFNTEKVTDMSYMFCGCYGLTTVTFPSAFNTSNVENMSEMFREAQYLTTLDLSTFETSKVKNMSYMFHSCNELTDINLSSFNTESVTTMGYMFNNCQKLPELDLSNFNTATVTSMNSMFSGCSKLKTLTLSDNFKVASSKSSIIVFRSRE